MGRQNIADVFAEGEVEKILSELFRSVAEGAARKTAPYLCGISRKI